MSSVFKAIFGGSESKSQSTSTPTDMTPDEFKGLRGPLASTLQSLLKQGGSPQYTGPLNADITDNETKLLGDLMAQGGNRQALLDKTLSGGFLPGQPGSNPFLEAAITSAQRPTLQGLTETLERSLPGRFTAAGQFVQPQGSSAFDRAAAVATRGAADALADIATNMSFGSYETERGRQQEAVTLSQKDVDTTIANLQAQGLPRLIQELGIERGIAEFNKRTDSLLSVLQLMGQLGSPTIAQTAQSTSEAQSTPGIIGALFPKGLFPGGL